MSSETTFVAAISGARDAESAWKALEALAKAVAGHKLFTVTTVDVPANVVRRAHSNMPKDYPTSGTKPLHGNTGNWFDIVFNQRRTFVANTIEDIATVFPDHELIGSLGCGSVVTIRWCWGAKSSRRSTYWTSRITTRQSAWPPSRPSSQSRRGSARR